MSQHYSDPERRDDPHALPDVEVFHCDYVIDRAKSPDMTERLTDEDRYEKPGSEVIGWYWWTCLPGCLPDSDPVGPFKNEKLAIADALA